MTTYRENFRPVTDVLPVVRRDLLPADKTLVNPANPLSLIDGEWVTLNSNAQLVRPFDITQTAGSVWAGTQLCWPLWAENGRFDIQAMADNKTPVLWLNAWEFETRIFDPAAVVNSGAAITAILQPVKVASISIGGFFGTRTLSGLVGHGASESDRIVGYVTRLPAANNGWLRIRGGTLY
jgi:hypothetical protein